MEKRLPSSTTGRSRAPPTMAFVARGSAPVLLTSYLIVP